jgi:hypothetical protein
MFENLTVNGFIGPLHTWSVLGRSQGVVQTLRGWRSKRRIERRRHWRDCFRRFAVSDQVLVKAGR